MHICNNTNRGSHIIIDFITISRQHTNPSKDTSKEDKVNSMNTDANRTVDNIVDDILSAEDDYMTIRAQREVQFNQFSDQANEDYLMQMQVEFLKDMNHLHSLDDELLYKDIDLDGFQVFNANLDCGTNDRNGETLFDFPDNSKSIDQEIMNALCQVKTDLPEEFLGVSDVGFGYKPNEPVSVNECDTIFESDVDLEASANLAANLNQLIGENTVQYISTEDDDTFIISLNSEIDAEQLTDMLNIGAEAPSDKMADKVADKMAEAKPDVPVDPVEPIVVQISEVKQTNDVKTPKGRGKKKVIYVCRTCNKVFNKKDNYRSHIGKVHCIS